VPDTAPDSFHRLRRHRWLIFKIAALLLPLALALVGLELALHLGSYGYPTQFLIEKVHNGRRVLADNPRFMWRFVPRPLARAPLPIQIAADKPPDCRRIFVFGESAAMGDPEPAFGFSRILQVLLENRFPGQRVEVVNTAFPAINSHVIREIANDSRRARADVWLIYMGNNEVLGPYGLTSAFGSRAPPALAIRTTLHLRRLRMGQLLSDLAAKLGPALPVNAREIQDALTREAVGIDDPRLRLVYRRFEDNLSAIIRAGIHSGSRVVICTIVSNLKDCAPFMAGPKPDLPEPQLASAAARESRHAELQFQLGRACLSLGQTNEARQHLAFARDLDGFRARADSRINEIIRHLGARYEPLGVRLLDAETAFAEASPGGVTGDEFLCDHVHFRFSGNYLLARLAAELIARLPASPTNATAQWLTLEECGERLALTDWSRYRLAAALRRQLSAPLFQRQSNHAERDARLRNELIALELGNRPQAFEQAAHALRTALARSPNDWVFHDQLGKVLFAAGDRQGAAGAWSNVVRLVPHAFIGHYQLGLLLNQPATAAEALSHLRAALELRPFVPEVHIAIGTAQAYLGQPARADAAFQRALAFDPNNEPARIAWAQALRTRGDITGARAQLEHAVATNTNSLTAHLHLARLLADQGRMPAASNHFREVLRLDPRNELARRFFANP
jgi:tetratricopeptide (TPR) repeat protein